MSRFSAVTDNPHDGRFNQKTGILLTNLGSPDAPTPAALRTYLREFLSDPRIVEIPRLVWMIILHGIILRIRPKRSAKLDCQPGDLLVFDEEGEEDRKRFAANTYYPPATRQTKRATPRARLYQYRSCYGHALRQPFNRGGP